MQKVYCFQCFAPFFLHSNHTESKHRTVRLRLLYFQAFHEPPILLWCQTLHLVLVSRPLVCSAFQTLIQKNEAVLFPVQALNPVSPPPTKQKQCIGKRIQLELLLYHAGQTIYSFSQVCVPAGNVDLIRSGKIVQHVFNVWQIVCTSFGSAPE